jgi:hypothetical protein
VVPKLIIATIPCLKNRGRGEQNWLACTDDCVRIQAAQARLRSSSGIMNKMQHFLPAPEPNEVFECHREDQEIPYRPVAQNRLLSCLPSISSSGDLNAESAYTDTWSWAQSDYIDQLIPDWVKGVIFIFDAHCHAALFQEGTGKKRPALG